jgi:hypothetical protein
MRTASILLALVVVLGFVREATAFTEEPYICRDYSVVVREHRLGFADWACVTPDWKSTRVWSCLHCGRLGDFKIPFTATQGFVGFCVIVVALIALAVVLTVRWKRKQPNPI